MYILTFSFTENNNGSPKLLDPLGPVQSCIGNALPHALEITTVCISLVDWYLYYSEYYSRRHTLPKVTRHPFLSHQKFMPPKNRVLKFNIPLSYLGGPGFDSRLEELFLWASCRFSQSPVE
jgi:hypothetical protein